MTERAGDGSSDPPTTDHGDTPTERPASEAVGDRFESAGESGFIWSDPVDDATPDSGSKRSGPDPNAPNTNGQGVDASRESDHPRRSGSGRAPLVAVAVAVSLGVLGPLIALFGGFGVFALNTALELGLVANIVLTLFVGQYVAFAGLAIAYLAYRGFDRAGIISYLGVKWPSLTDLGIVIVGWVVILVSVMGISLVIQLLGADPAANQSAELALANPAIIPLFIAASFLVIGPCEEILYRGVVQGRLRESMPAAPAIVIAAAIFALIHVMALTGGITGRLTTVAVLFFPSLVFGIVYEYTENIVVPSLLHGLHNAVIFTLLYVTVMYADEFEEFAEMGAILLGI